MVAYARRSIVGGAVATTITAGITNASASFAIAASTGWPDGSAGDFFVVIDPGTTSEEKVRCSTRSTLTVNVQTAGRGSDGSSAIAHASGAVCYPIGTALDLDEANLLVSKLLLLATAAGQIPVVDAANSFAMVQAKTSGQVLIGNGTTLASVAFSGDVTVNSSGVTAIGTGKVLTAMIGALQVTTAKIAAGAVTGTELASGAVTAGKIAVGGVSAANQFGAGVVDAAAIATGAVTSTKILDGTIATGDIAALAIDATLLAADAVTTAKILDANVTAAKIAAEAASTYTPTLTQTGTVTKTVTLAEYLQFGKRVEGRVTLTVTGSGTGGAQVISSLPVNATHSFGYVGSGVFIVGGSAYPILVEVQAGGTVLHFVRSDAGITNAFGADPNVALANGDILYFNFSYIAA